MHAQQICWRSAAAAERSLGVKK